MQPRPRAFSPSSSPLFSLPLFPSGRRGSRSGFDDLLTDHARVLMKHMERHAQFLNGDLTRLYSVPRSQVDAKNASGVRWCPCHQRARNSFRAWRKHAGHRLFATPPETELISRFRLAMMSCLFLPNISEQSATSTGSICSYTAGVETRSPASPSPTPSVSSRKRYACS